MNVLVPGLFGVLALGVLVALIGYAHWLRQRARPLSRVTVTGGEVVVDLDAPVWLAFRRRLAAPLGSVTGARVVKAGTRARLTVRVCGLGYPGVYLGWFLRRGTGLVYVARRPAHPAVEIDVQGGRVKQWLVESATPDEVVAALSGAVSSARR